MRARWSVLVIAIVASIAVLSAWVANDPLLSEGGFEAFSSYNTSPGGLSQAFAYLETKHHGAHRLERDIAREKVPSDAVVLRVGSVFATQPVVIEKIEKKKSKKKEKPKIETKVLVNLLSDEDEAWVRSGGRLIIAPSANVADIVLNAQTCSKYHDVYPVEPPLPAPSLDTCHSLGGSGLQRFHSLITNDDGPVLARWPLGSGEVLLFSLPEAFSNEYLDRDGNLALLERLAGDRRAVYFDETLHGIEEKGSVSDVIIGEWRLGPAIAILAVAAMAAFWRRVRPNGAPDRADADTRTEGVELVQSLGQLYDRAVDRDAALRLYYQAFTRAVHARTGLTGEPLERFVRERTTGYDPSPRFHDITKEEFLRALEILNHAHETVGHATTR